MKKDRIRNNFYILFGALAALGLLALAVLLFVLPQRTYSEREKRVLNGFPTVNADRIFSGRFMDEFEDFAQDQFVLRDEIWGIRGYVNRFMENRESNGIYLLRDGSLAERFYTPEARDFDETVAAVTKLSESAKKLRQYFLLAPTALTFAGDSLPVYADGEAESKYIDRFYAALPERITTVDIRPSFRLAGKDTQLYYRTDHHWTTDGARVAASTLLGAMDLSMDYGAKKGVVSADFIGTLAAKSGFPVKTADAVTLYKLDARPEDSYYFTVYYEAEQRLAATFYEASALKSDNPYDVFFGGNHARIDIRTTSETGRRLLLIKDSYANAAIPFLAESFEWITVIDPRYYDGDLDLLLQEEKFTDLVFLYNANTLSTDMSLRTVIRNEQ